MWVVSCWVYTWARLAFGLYLHPIRIVPACDSNGNIVRIEHLSCKSYVTRVRFWIIWFNSNAVQYPIRFNLNAFKSNSSSESHDVRFEHFIEIICGPKLNAVQSSYELNMCLISPGEVWFAFWGNLGWLAWGHGPADDMHEASRPIHLHRLRAALLVF